MSKMMDAYPQDTPWMMDSLLPNYYDVLEVGTFEQDLSVIERAAERRLLEIHACYAAWPDDMPPHLLDRIDIAKRCLLEPIRKAAYDRALKCQLSETPPIPIDWQEIDYSNFHPSRLTYMANNDGKVNVRSKNRERRQRNGPFWAGVVSGLTCVAALVICYSKSTPLTMEHPTNASASQNGRDSEDTAPSLNPPCQLSKAARSGDVLKSPPTSAISNAEERNGCEGHDDRPLVSRQAALPSTSKTIQDRKSLIPDAKQQAIWRWAMTEARNAMAERNLSTASTQVDTAMANAQTPDEKKEVARLAKLLDYLERFWNVIRQGAAELETGEELVVDNTRIAIIDSTVDELSIRDAGVTRTYRLRFLPVRLAMTIAEQKTPHTPQRDAACGAFLAMDRSGDRTKARRYWEVAIAAGLPIKELLEEL